MFSQRLHEYFADVIDLMTREIHAISPDDLRSIDVDQLSSDLAEKYKVETATLGEDISSEEPPFSPGSRTKLFTFYLPFTGNRRILEYHGTSTSVIDQRLQVDGDNIVIQFSAEPNDLDYIRHTVHRVKGQIQSNLDSVNHFLKTANPSLKDEAKRLILERQHHFASHRSTVSQLQQLFPLRRRDDQAVAAFVPVRPRPMRVLSPNPTPSKPQPEPELSLADYGSILQVIQNMITVCERSPSVFKTMKEEDFRTILLVGLNGIFQGDATAETFNGAGKTDILIRVNNNNIFISECLIWDGPEYFRGKLVNQLFGYSTWRDSKLAAIIFNRKKDFTSVVQKMKEVVNSLDNRIAEIPCSIPSSCRHRLRRKDDPQKEFILTCLAFEVPT